MMMAKPAPEKTEKEETPKAPVVKKDPAAAVEQLEKRLAMLGGGSNAAPVAKPVSTPEIAEEKKPAPAAPAPAAAAPAVQGGKNAAAAPAVQGGKNALLARIMAAKERSQKAQNKVEPPKQEPVDLLSGFDAPAKASDPPPSYDTNFLQTPAAPVTADMPPPEFSSLEQEMNFPAPPPIDAVAPPPAINDLAPPPIDILAPPPFESMAPPPIESLPPPSAPVASAPMFEDLLDSQQHAAAQNPLEGMHALPPPAASPAIDEDILAALDPAERDAILEEQRKIMEAIEKNKANDEASGAAARAMAFDQRSSAAVARVAGSFDAPASRSRASRAPAARAGKSSNGPTVNLGAGEQVPLHGKESTQKAIEDGTAVIIQCVNCHNWMQVTNNATLMFCPTCQVVSPVDKAGAATSADMEAAAQLAADMQLAEKLQNEEYQQAEGAPARRKPPKAPAGQKIEVGQSWYDWMVGNPAKPATPERGSAEIRRSPGLVPATTGEQPGRGRSYDESEGLIGSGGARVAEQKSMFSCVADSISTAATQMTAYNLDTDQEGNVHGVDSSSLLAMPDVSRQRE